MKKQKTQNSKHKIPNTNNGITLIALVITIIVMLILVAVTITMAVNGGLFEYAGRAGTKTNQAVANEQELANLEANMTVDELIDKYTGSTNKTPVDLSVINIGDYVNYPVEYTNVATVYDASTGAEMGNVPTDEFDGWRVLSKETDEQGNILYVKLISAGVPLSYYHPSDEGSGYLSEVALTTNFLTTGITSTLTKYKFYKCGFENVAGATLASTFANKFTEKVQALTKSELDKAACDLGGETTAYKTYVNDPKYKDLLAVPCSNGVAGGYCWTWLGTAATDVDFAIWGTYSERVHDGSMLTDGLSGVRPVVSLKSGVQFTPAPEAEWKNVTTTWDISI